MINLYYTPASGSVSSSLSVISNSSIISNIVYTNVTLEITASAYESSGSDFTSTVGDLRTYIKSGSAILASFPTSETNIIYTNLFQSPATPLPFTSSFNIDWSFTPSTSSDVFKIYNSTTSTYTLIQSQSYYYGSVTLNVGDNYKIIVSGSNQFYTSSITIQNNSTKDTLYYTSSNSYLTASFSSSNQNSYVIIASTSTLPYIQLSYSGTPVTPTSSLDAWNTYLDITASSIINSGSSVYLTGGTLDMLPSFSLSDPKSKDFTNFYSYGLYSLISCSIIDGTLLNIPNISVLPTLLYLDCSRNTISSSLPNLSNNSGLIYFNCSSNNITGSIPSFTSSGYPYYFNCSNNKISGSIPNLANLYNLQYFDCSYNLMSGSILSSSLDNCYNLEYFYCHQNSLTGSIPDLSKCYVLEEFNCKDNKISGSIPILSSSVNLKYFNCKNNRISGSIPNLDYNTILDTFICSNNNLTGSIPSLASASVLTYFECASNNLSNYISGSVSPTLLYFSAESNSLSQTAIDGLLQDFDNAGGINGYLNLSGSSNAVPSTTTRYTNLINKGWVVYTGSYYGV
jgi:hypothetical protein